MFTCARTNWKVLLLLSFSLLLSSKSFSIEIYATHAYQNETGWYNINGAEGAPDGCSDINNYARNFDVTTTTNYLYNDSWQHFTIPPNQVIKRVMLNFNGRPDAGYSGTLLRVGAMGDDGAWHQQEYSVTQPNNENCYWMITANSDSGRSLTSFNQGWTVSNVRSQMVRVRSLNDQRLRINSMKLTIATDYPQINESLLPTVLDFGTIQVGQTQTRTFTLQNLGWGLVTGNVGFNCNPSAFSMAPSGNFSLQHNQGLTYTVTFSPQTAGNFNCTISTGLYANATTQRVIQVLATAVNPCGSVSPPSLVFPPTCIGSSSTLSYIISNCGVGPLSGVVALNCGTPEFSVTAGSGSYTLQVGQTRTVTVRYQPTDVGSDNCSVSNGTYTPSVPISGQGVTGYVTPSTALLDFGVVPWPQAPTLSVTLLNNSLCTVSGNVSFTCNPEVFSFQAGNGPFTLAPGGTRPVTLQFATGPHDATLYECHIDTGVIYNGQPVRVQVRAQGGPGICDVTPPTLAFGNVAVGLSATLPFTINNSGVGLLVGSVELVDVTGAFGLVEEEPTYSIPAGGSDTFHVRFTPPSTNNYAATISTDCPGQDITCMGAGSLQAPVLRAINAGTIVSIQWDPVPGADFYNVYGTTLGYPTMINYLFSTAGHYFDVPAEGLRFYEVTAIKLSN